MNHKELIQKGQDYLEDPHQARLLLLDILKEKDQDLFLLLDQPVEKAVLDRYNKGLSSLKKGMPLAYFMGYHWFYGYKILVNENTLIPRSETEELVAHVLAYYDEYFTDRESKILDLATGSGAIAISLSKELNKKIWASDISEKAVSLAEQSAQMNQATVVFSQGDLFAAYPLENQFDIIVSNPPYIKEIEDVQDSVLNYEPHIALFGGQDGLYFYREILQQAASYLKKSYLLAFEIGYDIGDDLKRLAKKYFPRAKIEVKQDMNGLDRFLFISEGLVK